MKKDRRYAQFERKARAAVPAGKTWGPESELRKIADAIAKVFEDSFRGLSESRRRAYLLHFVKRNRHLERPTLLARLIGKLLFDLQLEDVERDGKSHPLGLRQLLKDYVEFGALVSELEGDTRPAMNEAARRWIRVEAAFKKLSAPERWSLFDQLIVWCRAYDVSDYWMLRDLSQHLVLGKAQPLVELVVEAGYDDSGRHTNIKLFRALSHVADQVIPA